MTTPYVVKQFVLEELHAASCGNEKAKEFDASGKETFGPPPRPLDLPPFEVKGNTIVLGNEGPECQKIAEAMKA
jgi:hypothetical protein